MTTVLLAAGLGAATTAEAARPEKVIIRGQVRDTSGQGVSRVPVRVIATRRVVKFLKVESKPVQAELAATLTDATGFYEIQVPRDRDFDDFYLRFYDRQGFDAVKYAVPPDVDITRIIRKGRVEVLDQNLEFAPGWDAVSRLVGLYGEGSPRGEIVRQLGVPDRTERVAAPAGGERETWWYDAAGVAYVLEDGRVIERTEFEPHQESTPIARQ
jgi:hypothetical protein